MNAITAEPTSPEHHEHGDPTLLRGITAQAAAMAARLHDLTMEAAAPDSPLAPQQRIETLIKASVAFDRYARIIHRTVALTEQIAKRRAAAQAAAQAPAKAEKKAPKSPARIRVIRAIQAAHAERDPNDEQSFFARIVARIHDSELDHGVDGQPITEAVIDICQDLGIYLGPFSDD